MKIDKYERISKGKYRMYLSNGEVIDIFDDVIISNELLLKQEMDIDTYNKVLRDNEFQDVYNSCVKYITVRIRCIKEIRDYLRRKNIDSSLIDLIIDRLIKDKLLDDDKFCECFIKDKLRFTSWGPYRIIRELNNYNIDNSIINKYNYLVGDDVIYDKLYKLIIKRINSNHKLDNRKLRDKIYKYFISIGYESGMIISILNDVL